MVTRKIGNAGGLVAAADVDFNPFAGCCERTVDRPLAALEDRDHTEYVVKETIRLRSELTGSLRELGLTVYPSQTNFVLIEFPATGPSAKQAYSALREQGIVLRRFSAKAFANCVRFTIGLAPDTKAAAEALAHFVRSHG